MSSNYNPNTIAQANAFNAATSASVTPTNIFRINNLPAGEQTKDVNVNFPVQMGSSDPEDEKYYLQSKLIGNNGVIPGVGQVVVGDEYMNYAKRKMNVAEQFEYESWLMKQVDWSSPESQAYWVSMFPWMRDKRFEYIDQVAELQKKDAKIAIAGPQTEDDWRFIYNKMRGVIKIPEKPIHMLSTAEVSNDYKRGMFSPMINYIPPYNDAAKGNAAFNPAKGEGKVTWSQPTNISAASKFGGPAIENFPDQLPKYFNYSS